MPQKKRACKLKFVGRVVFAAGRAGSPLARRSLFSRRSSAKEDGEGGCSVKITEDVRKYSAEQGITEEAAIEKGLKEKAKEFVKKLGSLRQSMVYRRACT